MTTSARGLGYSAQIDALSHMCELWSRPWHELQRSLAAGFATPAAACAAGQSENACKASTVAAGAPVGSWLARAHPRHRRTQSPQNNCRITVR